MFYQVNEPDNTVILAEVRKPVDEDEVAEDKVLIKDEVDGDVEEATSGGADLDPADQTLVGDAPQLDADVSVIQEISVSSVFCFWIRNFRRPLVCFGF